MSTALMFRYAGLRAWFTGVVWNLRRRGRVAIAFGGRRLQKRHRDFEAFILRQCHDICTALQAGNDCVTM